MSSSEALRIDAHDESCAHFKRRVGSLDGLDDRGARLTYAYTRSCSSIPCAHELILDYLEGVEHDSAIRVEPRVRHGAIRAHFTRSAILAGSPYNQIEFIVKRIIALKSTERRFTKVAPKDAADPAASFEPTCSFRDAVLFYPRTSTL